MTTKQCGTCEFWDRDTQDQLYERDVEMYAVCAYELPIGLPASVESMKMRRTEGQDCPVYNEIKEE